MCGALLGGVGPQLGPRECVRGLLVPVTEGFIPSVPARGNKSMINVRLSHARTSHSKACFPPHLFLEMGLPCSYAPERKQKSKACVRTVPPTRHVTREGWSNDRIPRDR